MFPLIKLPAVQIVATIQERKLSTLSWTRKRRH